jgi:hypothetical protein
MVWAILNPEQSAAIQELVDGQKSDRIVAIVGGTILDNSLASALRFRLRVAAKGDTDIADKLFKISGALGNLGPKIDLGYLLYMFDKPVRNALYGLSEIRNFFAHNLVADMKSTEKKFAEAMGKLTLHKGESHYLSPMTLKPSEYAIEMPDGPRDVFIINLKVCLIWLMADGRRHGPWTNQHIAGYFT